MNSKVAKKGHRIWEALRNSLFLPHKIVDDFVSNILRRIEENDFVWFWLFLNNEIDKNYSYTAFRFGDFIHPKTQWVYSILCDLS